MVSLLASNALAHVSLMGPHTKNTPPTSRPPTSIGSCPTNDDIEAIIQMATSAHAGPAHLPPRDTRTQLFVGNLPYRVRWQDLKDLFRRAGTVLRADVSLAPDNRSRGYGTVLLATAEDAGRAVDMFNGFVWQTRTLEVRLDRMAAEDPQLQVAGGVALGGGSSMSASASGAGTPYGQPSIPRIGPSPPLYLAEDSYLNIVSPIAGLSSPTTSTAQLTGVHTPIHPQLTGSGAERSRNLFVGNLPFHIQWQDLKDLFRQAGTILRADVALGPDGRSRGFGTVSFATESDAERAVRMFNGFEFNGRQLKVHFDKFSAASATALPMTGLGSNITTNAGISISAPQSPHAGASYASLRLQHAASFAQQMMMHQHEQTMQSQAQQGLESAGMRKEMYQTSPFALQRSATDSHAQTFRFQLPNDERVANAAAASTVASAVPESLLDPPSVLTRAKSDTAQQLFPHTGQSHTPHRMLNHQQQSPLYQSSQPEMHNPQMHLPLQPARPSYAFDSSPGSPYDLYHLTMAARRNGQADGWKMELATDGELDSTLASVSAGDLHEALPQPSTSPAPASGVEPLSRTMFFAQHAHSQSASATSSTPVTAYGSAQDSQPNTQAASPTSSTQSSFVQSANNSTPLPNATHPAHPGPISLPPPPSVAGFPIPPPHTLSPVYHPQMSPYASPLHHPAVMMGMMGVNMTPHGLPPITPSMPSFTFLPQPSPNAMPPNYMGDSASSNPPGSSQPNGPGDPQQQHHTGVYIAHLHPHGPMLSPYTPFSPGVAMSPGAFWGKPGSAGVNPYMNPAVGAPVHPQQHTGYFPPIPPRQLEEPQGYFPPFVSASSVSTSKPSGLANEIRPDGSSTNGSVGNGHAAEGLDVNPLTQSNSNTSLGTDASIADPSSSNGTSWQTDSAETSPDHALANGMGKLALHETKGDNLRDDPPRAHSAGAYKENNHAQPLHRAGSDPAQAVPPVRTEALPLGTNGHPRLGLGLGSDNLIT